MSFTNDDAFTPSNAFFGAAAVMKSRPFCVDVKERREGGNLFCLEEVPYQADPLYTPPQT